MELAPIVLFVYKRLEHTKRTVEALKKNVLAKESDLYIFSDGAKTEKEYNNVREVREYLKTINGFKTVKIFKHALNVGLAENIITGVGTLVDEYGKVIVLEDDLVTSPFFLSFMNSALEYYANEKSIWHIGGWNYPVSAEGIGDTFAWRSMQCWGWATWKERWQYFEKNSKKLIDTFSQEDIHRFNLDGIGLFWNQVLANYYGTMNSWAVFWYATIFQHKGLCISPTQSYVENIGFDGTGEHTGWRENFSSQLNQKNSVEFTNDLIENELALNRIKLFYREQENKNLTFSKNLNILFARLKELIEEKESYIVYGAGTGAMLLCNYMPESIIGIVDKDIEKIGSIQFGNKVYGLDYLALHVNKIIISPFGRSDEIVQNLNLDHNISIDRIISLDIFDHTPIL